MITKIKSKTGAVSVVIVTAIVAIILAAAITAVAMRAIADEKEEPIYTVTDIELNVGRYYLNGDTKNHYFEVFEDKTIQLGGIDPIDYYWTNKAIADARDNGVKTDEEWLKKYCEEELGARRYYNVVKTRLSENMILGLYREPPEEEYRGGTHMIFVDINTISSAERVFVYVKE